MNSKKNKRKKIIIFISLFLLVLIILSVFIYFKVKKEIDNSPVEVTKKYLDAYNKLGKSVMSNIKYEYEDVLNDKQKSNFAKAMRRQYEKMGYSIIRAEVKEYKAIIKTEVTVFDYNSCWNWATDYVNLYGYRFSDQKKMIDYKINQVSKCKEKVTYDIKFIYIKKDNKWVMNKLEDDDLRKINGTY